MSFDFSQPEPGFMGDPEEYWRRFWRSGSHRKCTDIDEASLPEPCAACGQYAEDGEDLYICQECQRECCEACSYDTAIADGKRCAACEEKHLEALKCACRNIACETYQMRIAEAIIREDMAWNTLLGC